MSAKIRVKAHALRNYKLDGWKEKIAGRWSYKDLVADPTWFRGWISFDAVAWNPSDKKVYCGLNSMDGDLLYAFDPRNQQFECMNTQRWTDEFDVKIHRTLLLNSKDRCFYFGTSQLHDVDRQREAPGGKLVRFDPGAGEYQIICVPVPHLYIQSVAADWKRDLMYGFTYPAEAVFKTDLRTGASEVLAYISNSIMLAQPHNAVVDKEGRLWGTYAETRAWDETTGREPIRLFMYDPAKDSFVWYEHGLARRDDPRPLLNDPVKPAGVASALGETRHREDYGFCDSMAYDGERYIYAGTVAGVLARIDTQDGRVEKMANVVATGRFPALLIRDGHLFGAGGLNGHTQFIHWDMRTDRIEGYTDLTDPATNERPARVHDITMDDDGQIYLAENDNQQRSSYLWTIRMD